MNYIQLLTAFYKRMSKDERLGSTHTSLYLALFQLWNMKKFNGPVDVNRSVLMRYSKIGSNHTFYKCLNELSEFGYIFYERSFSPSRLSKIHLFDLDSIPIQNLPESQIANHRLISEKKYKSLECRNDIASCANSIQVKCKSDIGNCADSAEVECNNDIASCAKMHTNIKNINIKSLKRECVEKRIQAPSQKEELDNGSSISLQETQERKKVAKKKESNFKQPNIETIIDFFMQNDTDAVEGKKFFYHYQSNGWKVGGKSAMNDWQSAALKWILNIDQFRKVPKVKTTLNLDKDYGEPL